jgi:putative heme degradation protein
MPKMLFDVPDEQAEQLKWLSIYDSTSMVHVLKESIAMYWVYRQQKLPTPCGVIMSGGLIISGFAVLVSTIGTTIPNGVGI